MEMSLGVRVGVFALLGSESIRWLNVEKLRLLICLLITFNLHLTEIHIQDLVKKVDSTYLSR